MEIMMKMVPVSGKALRETHPIRMTTADNVRLWLLTDKYMAYLTKKMIRTTKTKAEAAQELHRILHEVGLTETPDGAKLTITSIRRALLWQDGY